MNPQKSLWPRHAKLAPRFAVRFRSLPRYLQLGWGAWLFVVALAVYRIALPFWLHTPIAQFRGSISGAVLGHVAETVLVALGCAGLALNLWTWTSSFERQKNQGLPWSASSPVWQAVLAVVVLCVPRLPRKAICGLLVLAGGALLAQMGARIYHSPLEALDRIWAEAKVGDKAALNKRIDFEGLKEDLRQMAESEELRAPGQWTRTVHIAGCLYDTIPMSFGAVLEYVERDTSATFLISVRQGGTHPHPTADFMDSVMSVKRDFQLTYLAWDQAEVQLSPTRGGSSRIRLQLQRQGLLEWRLTHARLSPPQTP